MSPATRQVGTDPVRVSLREWETMSPTPGTRLAGRSLADPQTRAVAARLTNAEALKVEELRDGIRIAATSFVGRVRLGDLEVTVCPKIGGPVLLRLLRYAYHLRDLQLFDHTSQATTEFAFQDLLLHQLAAEARYLIGRGLHRTYLSLDEELAAPRGRLDLQRLARQGGVVGATLPCRHYPRDLDCLVNQVLLAGLREGARLTEDLALRVRLRRLAGQLADDVSPIPLNGATFARLHRESNRLVRAYEPALRLVELIASGRGVLTSEESGDTDLPGFLFDMNRFFQALLSRFLRESLPEFVVEDERRLRGMLAYEPGFRPENRKTPSPRPDYIVSRPQTDISAIVDAKYIDLWAKPPGRDIVYQLAMYALSRGVGGTATILYPATDPSAREARLAVSDTMRGSRLATISLRPVLLDRLDEALAVNGATAERRRTTLAHQFVFGAG